MPAGLTSGRSSQDTLSRAWRRAARCRGVVPQQPPSTRAPRAANAAVFWAKASGPSGKTVSEPRSSGRPALGSATTGQEQHLVRPQTAIGAQGRHAHVLHGLGKDGGRRARQADALFEGHGDHDGQVADLARGRHGGPGFGQVELGLDEDEVRATSHEAAYLLREGPDEIFRLHIAQGAGKVTARALSPPFAC